MRKMSMVGLGTGCSNIHSPTPRCKAPSNRKEVVPGAPHTSKKFNRVIAPATTSNHANNWSMGIPKNKGTTMATTPTKINTIPYVEK